MKTSNIFKSFPVFSLIMSLMIVFAACDRNSTHGPKSGEEGEEPEAYGLQDEDLGNEEGNEGGNAGDQANREGEYNEEEGMYPDEKIEEETNLKDDDPIELSGNMDLQKKMLMATLNGQRTDLEHQIRELRNASANAEDSSIVEGNTEELKLYLDKLDQEMAKVRAAEEENFEEVVESAQEAIQGAGALIVSREMRITEGY